MKKHSCGGVLYTIKNNIVYVILGKEGNDYFHFKGCLDESISESFKSAAIREIAEETLGLVKLDDIVLDYELESKYKHYHYGLVQVDYAFVREFNKRLRIITKSLINVPREYKEKTEVKLFEINKIFDYRLHNMTLRPLLYYYNILMEIQKKIELNNETV